jgi:hypothetical protein
MKGGFPIIIGNPPFFLSKTAHHQHRFRAKTILYRSVTPIRLSICHLHRCRERLHRKMLSKTVILRNISLELTLDSCKKRL